MASPFHRAPNQSTRPPTGSPANGDFPTRHCRALPWNETPMLIVPPPLDDDDDDASMTRDVDWIDLMSMSLVLQSLN
eukprot:scaffold54_cov158-Amphora_coffeaeformis.AAC.12